MTKSLYSLAPMALTRREFMRASSAGVFVLGAASIGFTKSNPVIELSGQTFDLTIGSTPVNYTGASRVATAVNDQVPGPLLRIRQGDIVTLRVTNRLSVPSSIHWHGLI